LRRPLPLAGFLGRLRATSPKGEVEKQRAHSPFDDAQGRQGRRAPLRERGDASRDDLTPDPFPKGKGNCGKGGADRGESGAVRERGRKGFRERTGILRSADCALNDE